MKKHALCAAVAAVVGIMSFGAGNSFALSAIAQGRPSIKPTAPTGSALRTYQLNCDPGVPDTFAITFSYVAPTGFDGFLPVTDVQGVSPYVLNADLIGSYITQLNGTGHSAQIAGAASTQPVNPKTDDNGNPDPDIYLIQFDKGLLQTEVTRQELTTAQQQQTFFKFFAGGADGDTTTDFDGNTFSYAGPEHQNEVDISIYNILNGPAAAPLPSAALGACALVPLVLLTRRRQTVTAS